jgi:hypothetical protein
MRRIACPESCRSIDFSSGGPAVPYKRWISLAVARSEVFSAVIHRTRIDFDHWTIRQSCYSKSSGLFHKKGKPWFFDDDF